jgi:hypothetical protein
LRGPLEEPRLGSASGNPSMQLRRLLPTTLSDGTRAAHRAWSYVFIRAEGGCGAGRPPPRPMRPRSLCGQRVTRSPEGPSDTRGALPARTVYTGSSSSGQKAPDEWPDQSPRLHGGARSSASTSSTSPPLQAAVAAEAWKAGAPQSKPQSSTSSTPSEVADGDEGSNSAEPLGEEEPERAEGAGETRATQRERNTADEPSM